MPEARMREVIRELVAASMADMNCRAGGDEASGAGADGAGAGSAGAGGAGAGGAGVGGVGPAAPKITGCTYITFMKIASMGIDAANGTPWTEVRKWMTEEFYPRSVLQRLEQELYNLKLKGTDIDGYTIRFHELALLCPRMVEPEQTDEASEGEKRKGEGDRGGRGDNRRDYNRQQNQRRANAGAMTNDAPNDNKVSPKSKNK
ncbi:hypothetical protein Tco_0043648 [Tanacetum coccineum]